MLAVAGAKRSSFFPDVPTLAELGFKGAELDIWFGMWAPNGTPADVTARMAREIAKVLALPHVKKRLADMGGASQPWSPAQFDAFTTDWLQKSFEVSSQSNRMGVRLNGHIGTGNAENLGSIPSSPVVPGTVQVPPDGNPIILLADAQTIGGYPQIGTVITVDIPLVGQLKPGDLVGFELVSVEMARQLLFERERELGLLRFGLEERRHAH
jgi:allophanate hydrolase subunit 2